MMDSSVRIGIDFGGTKTEIVALDSRNGKELYRKRILNEKGSYEVTLQSFRNLVDEAEQSLGKKASVGMGMPGCISDDTGCVKNSNAVWMNGKPLKKDLESILGREVRIQNDANCFAVSEAVDGAGFGKRVVFGVIIGTGCGGGVAVDGQPVKGVNGLGGEWGHNPLPYPRVYAQELPHAPFASPEGFVSKNIENYTQDPAWSEYPGDLCFCGKAGCLETWISGTGFKRDYNRVTGEDLSTHDIIANARSGEQKAVAAFDRYVDRLARALSVVVNIIDPDVIVLGGGMSNVAALYDLVPKAWGRYIFSDIIHTQLKSPVHGDSSGVRGAAWLWGRIS
ncbi:MAG: ROK family protein [Pseudobdellovibrionaceae bacterium]